MALDLDALARDFVNTPRAPAALGDRAMALPRGFGAGIPPAGGRPIDWSWLNRPAAAAPRPVAVPRPVPAPTGVLARAGAMANRAVSRIPRFAGGAALGLPIATGVIQGVTDSQERVSGLAGDLGIDYNSFGGRIGANVLNTAQRIGNAFGAGAVYDKASRLAAGESFFEPYAPGAEAATAAPAAPTAPAAPAPYGAQAQVRAVDNGPATAATGSTSTALTADDIRGSTIPASGTGAILNTRTGAVTNIDSRGEPGYGAAPDESPRYPLGSVGSYVGAVMNQRQAASTDARRLAEAKLRVEGMGKGAAAAKAGAEADRELLQTAAARAHLKQNPGDYAGAAAVAAGRALPKDSFSVPFPPMNDKDPVTVLNKGTGALERRQPSQFVTDANIEASMAARKMTRAQTIEAYRRQGMDVSRIKP